MRERVLTGIFGRQRIAIVLAVLVTAGAIVFAAANAPPPPPRPEVAAGGEALPSEPLPAVEPVALKAVAPETAREINAAVPFADIANPAARPFTIGSGDAAYVRAVDCLAAAGYYEAGDDTEGQRSVMQVVLNRVRHPAFPKSVCGVVFQGAERVTGCQFTFTCDGALARRPSDAAWERARATARQALGGRVDKRVGVATHYHTDWVVPYWSSSLLKLTKVQTHLFFRWPGGWGSLGALQGRYAGAEPGFAKLAALSSVHVGGQGDSEAVADAASDGAPSTAAVQKILFRSDEDFLVLIKPGSGAESLDAMARALCGTNDYCKVRGWTDPATAPSQLPVKDAQRDTMAFSYLRDVDRKFERLLWNCRSYQRADKDDCIKGTYDKPDKGEKRLEAREAPREGKETVSLRRIAERIEEARPAAEPERVTEDRGGRRRPGQ